TELDRQVRGTGDLNHARGQIANGDLLVVADVERLAVGVRQQDVEDACDRIPDVAETPRGTSVAEQHKRLPVHRRGHQVGNDARVIKALARTVHVERPDYLDRRPVQLEIGLAQGFGKP